MTAIAQKQAPDSGKAEYTLTDAHFSRIVSLVSRHTGIVIKAHKRQMIYARLSRRLRALNLPDFDSYLSLLEGDARGSEVTHFINAVTTNLTSFFREDHHFEDLVSEVAPRLLQPNTRGRIWSAGCSLGDEPYTIAMSLHAAANGRPPQDLKILATDIDTNVLARAARGHVPKDRIGRVPARYTSYFRKVDDDTVEIDAKLKPMIRFLPLNLLQQWPMKGRFDVIFCRNVLIYFDEKTKAGLVDRFVEALHPGGTLYLGHSESLLTPHPQLRSLGRTIYRKHDA
ncbi:chemotaxis protein methyltransferase CheR [Rubricella aquisinus]|uniref:Chemotaxis protein methyltransferase n=1 Tax=Rubricella aquisinus TaxID=2028108 RepID=A0A840X1K9_9RHOB|nr:protein-glutamate O-methyltransferase CheR [Rubricella aquisinus]MBB5516654.1 chemotaxis protein methyltransferase CheR [Rubricella aquisinus]